jgi:hypothetical protein
MKKVLCQMCGLMNLDKFVTYPHCAGCGTRLAETAPPSSFDSWKRPLGAPLWATFLGLCCAGLGYWGITIARETGHTQERQLIAYVQTSRGVRVGQTASVELVLDTVESESRAVRSFSYVRLRLPRSLFKDFEFVGVKPPSVLQREGSGQYLVYDELQRDEPIVLSLRPRREGRASFSIGLFARDFTPFNYHGSLRVARAPSAKVTHSRQTTIFTGAKYVPERR